MTDLLERYTTKTPGACALFQRAQKTFPGGNTRHTYLYEPYPIYIKHGIGCRIIDVDGNEYYDLTNNMGPLILGHNDPRVVEAVNSVVAMGDSFAAPTALEIELGEMLCDAIPCAERVRFTVTGTEATMTALRATRAFTGRSKIAKFEGHYHGTHDYAQISTHPTQEQAGSPTAPTSLPDSMGLPSGIVDSVVVLPWNDFPACEAVIKKNSRQLASIILDPIANGSGIIPPEDGFLNSLKECAEQYDVLLVFDEIVSGFRLAYGGAQEAYKVVPDLATYGKIIGGGYPAGAVAGRADVMEVFNSKPGPAKVKHYGTYNAQPISMAAGIATLSQLKPQIYEKIGSEAQLIKKEIESTLEDLHLEGCVSVAGSMLYLIHFGIEQMRNPRDVFREDRESTWKFALGSICSGVYFVPGRSGNVSAAFGSEDIKSCTDSMNHVIRELAPEIRRKQST